jgi:hypothetical protein
MPDEPLTPTPLSPVSPTQMLAEQVQQLRADNAAKDRLIAEAAQERAAAAKSNLLNSAAATVQFASPTARQHALAMLERELQVTPAGIVGLDGRDGLTYAADQLASGAFAHFVRAAHSGGAGSRGDLQPPTPSPNFNYAPKLDPEKMTLGLAALMATKTQADAAATAAGNNAIPSAINPNVGHLGVNAQASNHPDFKWQSAKAESEGRRYG